jgi:hypothetical protein
VSDSQLFDYDLPKQPTKAKATVKYIKRPRTYMAIATSRQGPTFHRVRYVERPDMTHIAWCGLKGHRVSDSAKMVPECEACEKAFDEHAEKDGMA